MAFLGLAAAAALLATRTHYTTDLSAFLPRAPTASQRVLIEQLREGPAARLIIAALGGGDAAARARVSAALAQGLRADPRFAAVSNGDAQGLQADREFLFRHRYLLSEAVTPQRFTASGLHEAIAGSLAALAAPEGLLLKELFVQDPTGELLAIVDALGPERAPRTQRGRVELARRHAGAARPADPRRGRGYGCAAGGRARRCARPSRARATRCRRRSARR